MIEEIGTTLLSATKKNTAAMLTKSPKSLQKPYVLTVSIQV